MAAKMPSDDKMKDPQDKVHPDDKVDVSVRFQDGPMPPTLKDSNGYSAEPGPKFKSSIHTAGTNTSDRSETVMGGSVSSGRSHAKTLRRSSLSLSFFRPKKVNESQRNINFDDEEGREEFFLTLLLESVGDAGAFFGGCLVLVLVWSILCAWGSQRLRELAIANPGGTAEQWVEDIENCKNAVSILGTLFVFTLVFRFNACYDRWWESRIFWGDIISKTVELATMGRTWIANGDLADRMSRFIILFSYASKALLRGKSLNEVGEDGPDLVKRGLLTQEELDSMHDNPCWQPHYCIHMIREILVEAHSIPGGKGIKMDDTNKVHGQMFRCFDNTIKDLNILIGNCVRVRSSGLPPSYDAIVMMSFFAFFMIASVVWAVGVGWMSPIIIFTASLVILFLIVMGTKLVDPFGYDKVDIPLEAFCYTIEQQIYAIDQRSKNGDISHLARNSKPSVLDTWKCERRTSMHLIPKGLTKRR